MPHVAARSWITAGVAAASASLLVAAPITPAAPAVEVPAFELTAAEFDPISPWLHVLDHTSENAAGLLGQISTAPLFPVLQQVGINQIGYATSLLDGSTDLSVVLAAMGGNAQALLGAPFAVDWDLLSSGGGKISGSIFGWDVLSKAVGHEQVFKGLRLLSGISPSLRSLLDFTASPASGVLLGAVGPIVGPGLALSAGVQHALAHSADPLTALNDLVNIPAYMADAFFNGGPSLDALPAFDAIGFPTRFEIPFLARTSIDALGLTMGGLLSPEGSLFNAFDFTGSAGLLNIGNWSALGGKFELPGNEVGALGTLIGLPETLAKSIGWNGNGLLDELLGGSFFAPSSASLIPLGIADLLQQPLVDVAQFLGTDLAADLSAVFGADVVDLLGIDMAGNLAAMVPNLLLGVLG